MPRVEPIAIRDLNHYWGARINLFEDIPELDLEDIPGLEDIPDIPDLEDSDTIEDIPEESEIEEF